MCSRSQTTGQNPNRRNVDMNELEHLRQINILEHFISSMTTRQELVYALSSHGYFNTARPTNHPTIESAKKNNVHLSFIRCHEVYKGESKFKDPKQEEFFNRCSKSLPSKSQMFKSQITDAPSANNESNHHIHDLTELAKRYRQNRGNMTRSFNQGAGEYRSLHPEQSHGINKSRILYEDAQVLQVPKTLEQFKSWSSSTLSKNANGHKSQILLQNTPPSRSFQDIMEEARMDKSIHLDDNQSPQSSPIISDSEAKTEINDRSNEHASNSPKILINSKQLNPESPESNRYTSSQETSIKRDGFVLYGNHKSAVSLHNSKTGNLKLSGYVSKMTLPFESVCEKPEQELSEIEQLKLKLQEQEKQIAKYKNALSISERKVDVLECRLREKEQADRKCLQQGKELQASLGGQSETMLYFALFLTFLARSRLHN